MRRYTTRYPLPFHHPLNFRHLFELCAAGAWSVVYREWQLRPQQLVRPGFAMAAYAAAMATADAEGVADEHADEHAAGTAAAVAGPHIQTYLQIVLYYSL